MRIFTVILQRAIADLPVELISPKQFSPNPSSPVPPELLETIERIAHASWPGVPVIPVMETGGTDEKRFALPESQHTERHPCSSILMISAHTAAMSGFRRNSSTREWITPID